MLTTTKSSVCKNKKKGLERQGDLNDYILNKNPNINFDMYEIDTSIKMLDCIENENVIYGDFMIQSINKLYNTIVGI